MPALMPLLAILRANWRYAALGVLVMLIGIQSYRVGVWKGRAHLYEAKLGEVAAVQEAQNVKLEEWARDIETHSRELADNAQRKYEAGVAAGTARVEQYIARHRVQPAQDRGVTIHAPSIATPDSAGSSDRPGDSAELVAVTPDDVRICTINTRRLEAVREWAQSVER